MDMQHGYGHATWTWISTMDMDMQHGHGHATCHATWTWTCTMDINMQHGHGQATWTCTFSMDMDIHYGHVCTPGVKKREPSEKKWSIKKHLTEQNHFFATNNNSHTCDEWSTLFLADLSQPLDMEAPPVPALCTYALPVCGKIHSLNLSLS
jgi:hypothetical protein